MTSLEDIVFELKSVKLISKDFRKYLFSISESDYDNINSILIKHGFDDVKCLKETVKDDERIYYSISSYPINKAEHIKSEKFNLYNVKFCFQIGNKDRDGKKNIYSVLKINKDLGSEGIFEKKIKERNDKLLSKLS